MSNQAYIDKRQLPDLDLSATGTSEVINISPVTACAIQLTWTATGAPIGTVTIEGCIAPGTGGANFTQLNLGAIASPNNNASTTIIVLTDVQYPLLRVKYARTSGTGTMSIYVHAKGVR